MCRAGRAFFAGWVGTLLGWVGPTLPDASTTEPVAERSGQRTRVSTGRGPGEGRPPATAKPSQEALIRVIARKPVQETQEDVRLWSVPTPGNQIEVFNSSLKFPTSFIYPEPPLKFNTCENERSFQVQRCVMQVAQNWSDVHSSA